LISGAPVTLYRVGRGSAADAFRGSSADGPGDAAAHHLAGATDLVVATAGQALAALATGERHKHKAATAMNDRSSRAHSVFMLHLTQRHKGSVKRSQLHLVDLGGSEQVKRSKAEGETLQEAIDINTSLMVLGQVIRSFFLTV
jgi:hypothetical protein